MLPMIESHLKNRPGFNSKAMYRYAPQPDNPSYGVSRTMGGFSGRIMTGFTITAYAGTKR